MEKFRIIRNDGNVEYPAVSFVATNLRAKRVPWFHMPYTVPDHGKFYHHTLNGIYEIRDAWFYTHSLLQGWGNEKTTDR